MKFVQIYFNLKSLFDFTNIISCYSFTEDLVSAMILHSTFLKGMRNLFPTQLFMGNEIIPHIFCWNRINDNFTKASRTTLLTHQVSIPDNDWMSWLETLHCVNTISYLLSITNICLYGLYLFSFMDLYFIKKSFHFCSLKGKENVFISILILCIWNKGSK